MFRVKLIVIVLWCFISAPIEMLVGKPALRRAKEMVKTIPPRQRKKLFGLIVVMTWLIFMVMDGADLKSLTTDLAINFFVFLLAD